MPFDFVRQLDCTYLLEQCLHTRNKWSSNPNEDDNHSDSGYGSSLSTISEIDATYELYVPAPDGLSRDEAFQYHITTRNFFAYAVGRPVVGERLSNALVDLWKRLRDWLPSPAPSVDFTVYLERQGYLNLAESSEHALACLKFAEVARIEDVWIDAFVHCVGMHERLDLSPEWAGLSNTTIALITRASLEMDLHIARVVRALGCFLEEELGTEHLGLSKASRDHLDHFRSFLHAFYVDKLGYFPPSEAGSWSKRPWAGMYDDFQKLYEYLVDTESTTDWTSNHGLNGGICVTQNVQSFDLRHGYEPLPHPLPLLPKKTSSKRRSISSQRGLRSLKLGRTDSLPDSKLTPGQALQVASNSSNAEIIGCSLVQEYQRFERQKTDNKLDAAESRKVRWLLIYSTLQMLTSIMKAPPEVRDVKTPHYPLCVLTSGCPPWEQLEDEEMLDEPTTSSSKVLLVPDALEALEGRSSRISIHPDCEADNAEDFFASNQGNTLSRRESTMSLSQMPSPLRITTQIPSKSNSLRSSVHSSVQALHRSVVGSLTRKVPSRKNSLIEPKPAPSYCEILVENFDDKADGEEEDEEDERPQTAFRSSESPAELLVGPPVPSNPLQEFDFDLAAMNGEPVLESTQVASEDFEPSFIIDDAEYIAGSPCKSDFSTTSEDALGSNRSSILPDCDSPDTDISSWDGDSKRDSDASDKSFASKPQSSLKQLCYRPSIGNLENAQGSSASLNGGTYKPTGMIPAPVSRFAHKKTLSIGSVASQGSSIYPEEGLQAGDVEEESRGRGRSRELDRQAGFNFVDENAKRYSGVWNSKSRGLVY